MKLKPPTKKKEADILLGKRVRNNKQTIAQRIFMRNKMHIKPLDCSSEQSREIISSETLKEYMDLDGSGKGIFHIEAQDNVDDFLLDRIEVNLPTKDPFEGKTEDQLKHALYSFVYALGELDYKESMIVVGLLKGKTLADIARDLGVAKQNTWYCWKKLISKNKIWCSLFTKNMKPPQKENFKQGVLF